MRGGLAVVAAFAIAWPLAGFAEDLSVAGIEGQIDHDGAKAVVGRLTAGTGKPWRAVLTHIESGQEAWLKVAHALHPGVDAGSGEDLAAAVATALRNNPAPVLKMTGPDFPLAQVCDIPLIEPSDAQVARWKRRVTTALARVKDISLAEKVRQCRAAIAAIK